MDLAKATGAVGMSRGAELERDLPLVPLVLGVVYLLLWIALAAAPWDRFDWLLENLLVFAAVPWLIHNYRRCPLTSLSCVCLFIFLSLHAVGAHYTYSRMPLGDMARDAWGLSRNHYDRLVHFSFGLLVSIPVLEMQSQIARLKSWWSYMLPVAVTLSLSAIYEIIEWMVALVVDPDAGNLYLGTQGDEWDAQKDTALALAGAILSMTYAYLADQRGRPLHMNRCPVEPGTLRHPAGTTA
jgi:putative membrane protein